MAAHVTHMGRPAVVIHLVSSGLHCPMGHGIRSVVWLLKEGARTPVHVLTPAAGALMTGTRTGYPLCSQLHSATPLQHSWPTRL